MTLFMIFLADIPDFTIGGRSSYIYDPIFSYKTFNGFFHQFQFLVD